MEILNQFGFQPVLFTAQIINFLILVYIFNRFLYKPILKTLSDREKKIKQGLSDAENAAKELSHAEEKQKKIIISAGQEAEKILADTKKTAENLRDEILQKARRDADKIIADSKTQNALDRENMEKEIKSKVLDISSAILEKVLSDIFSKNEKDKILTRSMQSLEKIETG